MGSVHMAHVEGSSYRGNPPRPPPKDLSPRGSKSALFRRNDAGERMETNVRGNWRYSRNGGASTGTSPRQVEGYHPLCGAGLWPGLGVERLLSPPLPGRPAHPIYYAYRYGRAARSCCDTGDHVDPNDRRPHHAHLRQQGRVERLPRPPALLEILSGGPRCASRLRDGGGPYHHAGSDHTWRRYSGRVQVVGGYLVCLSHAHG